MLWLNQKKDKLAAAIPVEGCLDQELLYPPLNEFTSTFDYKVSSQVPGSSL
jgi:hypothetical protein